MASPSLRRAGELGKRAPRARRGPVQDSRPTAAVASETPRALRTRGCPRADRTLSVPASVHGTDPLLLRSPGWAARALSLLTPLSCPHSRHPRLGQHLEPPWVGLSCGAHPGKGCVGGLGSCRAFRSGSRRIRLQLVTFQVWSAGEPRVRQCPRKGSIQRALAFVYRSLR